MFLHSDRFISIFYFLSRVENICREYKQYLLVGTPNNLKRVTLRQGFENVGNNCLDKSDPWIRGTGLGLSVIKDTLNFHRYS